MDGEEHQPVDATRDPQQGHFVRHLGVPGGREERDARAAGTTDHYRRRHAQLTEQTGEHVGLHL